MTLDPSISIILYMSCVIHSSSSSSLVAKSCPTLATAWTTALQVPLSVGFSRQEYWSGLPFPSPCFIHINIQMAFFLVEDNFVFMLP